MTVAAVTWHDVENGAYDADLPLWRELAASADGRVLDLGAGTGRVAIDLAAHGHEVVALDNDPALLAALTDREPKVTSVTADARELELGVSFSLIIAPMQLTHILGGRAGRVAMLEHVHAHLSPGGTFAAALADPHQAVGGDRTEPPLPDMLERHGWVFSSQPVSVQERNGCVVVTRSRQAVSPAGELEAETVEIRLDVVSLDQFEDEARSAGLVPERRLEIPETPDHIGSTVVVCRR